MIAAGLAVALAGQLLLAQSFEHRGFLETRGLFYPQTAPGDSGRAVGDALLRWDGSYEAAPWLRIATSLEGRTDTHRQVEREFRLNVDDRSLQRPALSLRRMSATFHKDKFTVELGRQFIRWGKTDILNPTDRFAPKDYLATVVDTPFLGVTAVRATYESGADSIDFIWQPWFTPSRMPLLNQRWTVAPPDSGIASAVDRGVRYPERSQYGVRWNHIASRYEYSVSYFDGFNHLPLADVRFSGGIPPRTSFQRFYPQLRMVGADMALPLRWFTVKGEAAYFKSPDRANEDYILYVVQLERFVGEWTFVGGYAGETLMREAEIAFRYAPDRGFAESFVGRAAYTIDANRNFFVETAIRGGGSYVKFEYSQARGQHWRATTGFTWIRGDMADFLGQYHRNSYGYLALRYSF